MEKGENQELMLSAGKLFEGSKYKEAK